MNPSCRSRNFTTLTFSLTLASVAHAGSQSPSYTPNSVNAAKMAQTVNQSLSKMPRSAMTAEAVDTQREIRRVAFRRIYEESVQSKAVSVQSTSNSNGVRVQEATVSSNSIISASYLQTLGTFLGNPNVIGRNNFGFTQPMWDAVSAYVMSGTVSMSPDGRLLNPINTRLRIVGLLDNRAESKTQVIVNEDCSNEIQAQVSSESAFKNNKAAIREESIRRAVQTSNAACPKSFYNVRLFLVNENNSLVGPDMIPVKLPFKKVKDMKNRSRYVVDPNAAKELQDAAKLVNEIERASLQPVYDPNEVFSAVNDGDIVIGLLGCLRSTFGSGSVKEKDLDLGECFVKAFKQAGKAITNNAKSLINAFVAGIPGTQGYKNTDQNGGFSIFPILDGVLNVGNSLANSILRGEKLDLYDINSLSETIADYSVKPNAFGEILPKLKGSWMIDETGSIQLAGKGKIGNEDMIIYYTSEGKDIEETGTIRVNVESGDVIYGGRAPQVNLNSAISAAR